MRHWWQRSKREQKMIRRWARRALQRTQERHVQMRMEREQRRRERSRQEREASRCSLCGGNGAVLFGQVRGPRLDAVRASCPACTPHAIGGAA